VKFALRILEAMPDGTGVRDAMLDGKMQDDATWKQAKVISTSHPPEGHSSPPRTRT
jgi:malyl-CoA/(S)-citramalyl-CoA lyase